MQQQVWDQEAPVYLPLDGVDCVLLRIVAGPGKHFQSRLSMLLQEPFEPIHKDFQPVYPSETGTEVGLYRFEEVHIVPAPQLVCRKGAKIFFVFIQRHIDQAVAGRNGGAPRKSHDKIRQQALPSSVFFAYPEIIQFFTHNCFHPAYRIHSLFLHICMIILCNKKILTEKRMRVRRCCNRSANVFHH